MNAALWPRGARAVLLVWLLLASGVFAIAAPRVDQPGLYYDEAFMAQQAKDFFEPERIPDHAATVRTLRIGGRPFPIRNAIYLGSLKSQLMLPSFAVFGSTPEVLRLTTLGWSLLALLLFMLWTRQVLGTPTALVAGGLIAADPTYHFYSLYEWGPFTTGFLCRAAGILLLTVGWKSERKVPMWGGGLCLGLAVFNRAEFVVVLAALTLALTLVRPVVLQQALREKRALVIAAAIGLVLGAAPMWLTIRELLLTSMSWSIQSRGGWDEQLRVLWSMFDGSRFYRVIDAGGFFTRMFDGSAPHGAFGIAVALGVLATIGALGPRARREVDSRAHRFVVLAALGATVATMAVPGAVRAHHLLNAFPFFHLMVASCAVSWWGSAVPASAARRLTRVAVAAGLALVWIGGLRVIDSTYALIEATGGRGWWSDSLNAFAREIDGDREVRVVSLDWGFHEQLLFLTHEPRMIQPIWRIPDAVRGRGLWVHQGRPKDVYLIHEDRYDLFRYGALLLAAAATVEEREPGAVEIRRHLDRGGDVAFVSLRIPQRHRIVFSQGGFRIELH